MIKNIISGNLIKNKKWNKELKLESSEWRKERKKKKWIWRKTWKPRVDTICGLKDQKKKKNKNSSREMRKKRKRKGSQKKKKKENWKINKVMIFGSLKNNKKLKKNGRKNKKWKKNYYRWMINSQRIWLLKSRLQNGLKERKNKEFGNIKRKR